MIIWKYVGVMRENKWQVIINLEWLLREGLQVEVTMSEGWEGTNYPKGKERAFQTKGRENAKALWQKKSGMF